jgi:hypothetical protein
VKQLSIVPSTVIWKRGICVSKLGRVRMRVKRVAHLVLVVDEDEVVEGEVARHRDGCEGDKAELGLVSG